MKQGSNEVAVLIVGAGPVGLTLATQLQRQGIPYRLIEKNAGPSTTTKALAVHSRTLEIFRDVGIAGRMVDAGYRIPLFRVQSNGKTVLSYNFTLLDSAYPFLLSLPQPSTEAFLIDRLRELGGKVEWNTELTSLKQAQDGVELGLQRANGKPEQLRARWVAGCDGSRSTVRRSLGLPFEGDSYHRFFVLADVDIAWEGRRDEGVFFLGSQEGYVAVAPLNGDGRYRLFVEMPYDLPPEGQRPALDLPTFQRLCDGRGQEMRLSRESSTTIAAFQHRRVDTQRVGRCFLLGDAAHIGSPIGGQYMNMGIAEAYNLGWKLAFVERGLARPELLDSYDAERQPVAVQAEKTAHVLTKLLTLRRRPLAALRDTVIPLLSNRPAAQRKLPWMISGHRYNYRNSPIVEDARDNGAAARLARARRNAAPPRAGDVAPDVELWGRRGSAPQRLLDRFQQCFTLLLFVGGDESSPRLAPAVRLAQLVRHSWPSVRPLIVLDTLETPVAGVPVDVIADPDWRMHRRYGARDGLIVLVRPDAHIAFVGDDRPSLLRYMDERSTLRPAATSQPHGAAPQLAEAAA